MDVVYFWAKGGERQGCGWEWGGRWGSNYIDFFGASLYNHILSRGNFNWNLGIITTGLNLWRAQVVNSVDQLRWFHLSTLEIGRWLIKYIEPDSNLRGIIALASSVIVGTLEGQKRQKELFGNHLCLGDCLIKLFKRQKINT